MAISSTGRAGGREWAALGVLALPTMVLSMDLTVLHLAAPILSVDLAPSGAQLLWILDVYGFVIAGFLLVMGPLGDRVGRRRLLMVGAVSFAAASVVAAFAPTAESLIAARALLGVAGATLMPSTLSLLSDLFPVPGQRAFAIAVWMMMFTVGEAVGPLVGGVMLEFFWWGSVFLIAVPVMALLVVLGPALLPEGARRLPGRLDVIGTMLLLGAVLPLVYGVKSTALHGFGWAATACSIGGPALGVLFVRRQLRSRDPLMDLRLFRLPAFAAGLGSQVLAVSAMAGSQLLVMQYLQAVVGLGPLAAGLWTTPSIVLGVAATLLAARVVPGVRPGVLVGSGLLLGAVGAAMLAMTAQHMSPVWAVAGFTVLYVGVTPTLALTTDLIVGSAPRERSGMAAGVAESGAEFALAGGIAVFGTIATSVYQSHLHADAPTAGVRDDDLTVIGETVGNAVAVASGIPGDSGAALLQAVQVSYAGGVQIATGVAAAVLVAGAGLALGFLRGPCNRAIPADGVTELGAGSARR